MRRIIAIAFCWVLLQNSLFSQSSALFIGTDIPLFYTAGFQQQLSGNFSLDGRAGLLTKPYDVAILNILKAFDTDELLVNTIGEAFDFGLNIQGVLNWHIKKYYLGVTYSYLMLKAKDRPLDVLQNYYGINLINWGSREMTVRSDLHNAGLLFGRSFVFKNPAFAVNLELSVLKTFSSTSYVTNSDGDNQEILSKAVDKKLNPYYMKYGILPSVNAHVVYTFRGK